MTLKFLYDQPFDEVPGSRWSPPADVYRTPTGWVVKFDLAGEKESDLKIETNGSVLRVSGVRRDLFVERGYRHHSMEISYSHFERTLRLPCEADKAVLRVEYSEGMLVIVLDAKEGSCE